MKKILFFILFIGSQGSLFGQNKEKTYLLVHGAWHGAPLMINKGYKVVAIDLPSHGNDTTNPNAVTFGDYVKKVVEMAEKIEGQVILVGHSMGGTVISQAAEALSKTKVNKLIYLDAFLPQNGESVSSLARLIETSLPKDTTRLTIGNGLIVSEDRKTSVFKADVADILFYHDCSQSDKDFAHRNMSRQAFAPLGTPVSVSDSIYGAIPKYFILCTDSKDLNKSLLTTRVKCEKVVKLNSSHSPFFSKPRKLTGILMKL
jgi:pimeloyl-ACP methyl ester carboxylesterase